MEIQGDTSLETDDRAIFNLKKEYLKMNRLTQKLVFHLINMKKSDQKFGKFLIGILFGDQKKMIYEMKGLSAKHLEKKLKFQNIVNKHLKAAEELSKQEQKSKKKNRHSNTQNKQSVNKRLGSLLYPPERARKLETILNDEKIQVPSDLRNEDYVSPQKFRRLAVEVEKFENDKQGVLKKPSLSNENAEGLKDYVDFNHLPEKYFFHWEFLNKKVSFYQERLKNFYNTLNQLVVQRMDNDRENQRPVNNNERGYVPRGDVPMRYLMRTNNLRKRGNEEFEDDGKNCWESFRNNSFDDNSYFKRN